MAAAEAILGRPWSAMVTGHGDWGRDGVLYAMTHYGGYRLAELFKEVPGLRCQAAAQGVRRFRLGLGKDPAKERFLAKLKSRLSII